MLEIIGAGYGRTGTHSLALALERLRFGPCYNLLEVAKHHGHAELWNNAMEGKPVDWDQFFISYQSTVEWPSVMFIDELIRHFPNAKVILTLRDAEAWYESASKTIFEGLELSAYHPDPIKREKGGLARRLILERTFQGKYQDKEYAIAVYQKHNQHIMDTVPKGRLLQFNVKDGWEPLCAFLNMPIPEESFPQVNERNAFMSSEPAWAKKIRESGKQNGE